MIARVVALRDKVEYECQPYEGAVHVKWKCGACGKHNILPLVGKTCKCGAKVKYVEKENG